MRFFPVCHILQLPLLMSFTHRWMQLSFSLLFDVVGSAVLSASSLLCFQQVLQGLCFTVDLRWFDVGPCDSHTPSAFPSKQQIPSFAVTLQWCLGLAGCCWMHLEILLRSSASGNQVVCGDLMSRTHFSSLSLDRAVPNPHTSWLDKFVCLSSKHCTQP